MFSDYRSKKVVLVSHCILNQNAISDGTADYPATNESVLNLLIQSKVGMIQMPCPETLCLGLDRGDTHGAEREVVVENTRIRYELGQDKSIKKLNSLADQIVFQVEEYVKNGFSVAGVIGINRSPSCGVNTTSKNNKEVNGEGVFIERLRNKLKEKGININMIGIKALETEEALISIKNLLNK